jgi:hypothetical protein
MYRAMNHSLPFEVRAAFFVAIDFGSGFIFVTRATAHVLLSVEDRCVS